MCFGRRGTSGVFASGKSELIWLKFLEAMLRSALTVQMDTQVINVVPEKAILKDTFRYTVLGYKLHIGGV